MSDKSKRYLNHIKHIIEIVENDFLTADEKIDFIAQRNSTFIVSELITEGDNQ